jgi:hypothetical protein
MPLKKKDRDRLFEKDLEKGENNFFFFEDMNIIVYSANYYRHYYMHLIVSYGNGGKKLFDLYMYL